MTELEQCSLIKARKREPDRKPPPPRMIKRGSKKWREDDAISRHASRILQLKVTFVRDRQVDFKKELYPCWDGGGMGEVSCLSTIYRIEISTVVPG